MDFLEFQPTKHRHSPDRISHCIRRLATLVLQDLLPANLKDDPQSLSQGIGRLSHGIGRLTSHVEQSLQAGRRSSDSAHLSLLRTRPRGVSLFPVEGPIRVIVTRRYPVSGLILAVNVRTRLGSSYDRSSTRVPLHSNHRCLQDGKPGTTHFPNEDCSSGESVHRILGKSVPRPQCESCPSAIEEATTGFCRL